MKNVKLRLKKNFLDDINLSVMGLIKYIFKVKASNSLARLYSTSTMEHHHFDQCLMITNSKGHQILSNLSQVGISDD